MSGGVRKKERKKRKKESKKRVLYLQVLRIFCTLEEGE
jgi:hypothetical protein